MNNISRYNYAKVTVVMIPTVQAVALKTHIARDDARNYVALSDPAVWLRVKDDSD